jgi:hypothetical protein
MREKIEDDLNRVHILKNSGETWEGHVADNSFNNKKFIFIYIVTIHTNSYL